MSYLEKAMRLPGILPAGWLAAPSSDGVKKDAFGNVSRATVAREFDRQFSLAISPAIRTAR